jgi:hypothetical protein
MIIIITTNEQTNERTNDPSVFLRTHHDGDARVGRTQVDPDDITDVLRLPPELLLVLLSSPTNGEAGQ